MKTGTLWFFRVLSVIIAAAVSYGLWSANLIPFSVFNPASETAATPAVEVGSAADAAAPAVPSEEAPAADEQSPAEDPSAEAPQKSANLGPDFDALMADKTEGIDPELLQIWHSGKDSLLFRQENDAKVLPIHVLNLSAEAVDLQFFLKGVEGCTGTDESLCAQVEPQTLAVDAKTEKTLMLTVKGGSFTEPMEDASFDLLVLLNDSVQTIPLNVQYKMNDLWRIKLLFQEHPGNAVLQLIVFVLLTILLAILLMWKVFPYFFPRAYNVLVLNNKEDDTISDLWEMFMSEFLNLQQSSSNPIQPMPMPENIELPANIGSGDEKVKTILQLINLIAPKRGYSLSMKPVESKELGKGLILNLTKNEKGQIIATRTFWAKDYGLKESEEVEVKTDEENKQQEQEADTLDLDLYRKLVTPAILWVIQLYNKDFNPNKKSRDGSTEEDWESQALAILGRSVWPGDPQKGKQLFTDALLANPKNGMALSLMGRIWLEEAQKPDLSPEDAIIRLAFGMDYLQAAQDCSKNETSVYYAAGYNAVVGRLYQLSAVVGGAPDEHAVLLTSVTALIEEAESTSGSKISPKFKIYLERFIPMAVIVKYSIRLNQLSQPAAEDVALIVQALFNEMIPLLYSPTNKNLTTEDPLRCMVNLHYRAQYNYACFFSRCYSLAGEMKYANAALNYLTLALCHGNGLRDYAYNDPSLRPLHEDGNKALQARFEKLVPQPQQKENEEEEQPMDTAEGLIQHLPGITPEQVAAFAEISIATMTDLLMSGADAQGRMQLVQKCGIDAGHLIWWLNLCDLTRITGLMIEDAVRLESIGNVDTVKELAARNPENLHQTLRNMIAKEKLADWIKTAKQLIPVLKY